MAQFKGGKYSENGVLSYNYLGGKGGKGKGSVSIKKRGDSWYFVDEQGKVKNALGNGGKLTPTHMQNLERDGIFKNAKVNPETGGSFKGTEPASTTAGDNVGIDSSGNLSGGSASVQPSLAESNYELPEMSAPASQASKDFTPVTGDPKAKRSSAITPSTENAPPTLQSRWGGETARFNEKRIGSGYSENTSYIPDSVSLPETANMPTDPNLFTSNPRFDNSPSLNMQNSAPPVNLSNVSGGSFAPPYAVNENSSQTNYPISTSPDTAFSPSNTATGFSGGNNSNMPMDYSSGGNWSPSAESATPVATQADIDAGIKNQASPGMTSAEGWQAAGSVMKGVGGLASAYTGIKNYQLARDAHNTQKNQWQANYDQQLKAFEQNKKLANQEIQERNRILKSRNPDRTDLYKEL